MLTPTRAAGVSLGIREEADVERLSDEHRCEKALMYRVVADTNILIQALMFGGLPGSFLDLALVQCFILMTSPALLDELDEKLHLKFNVAAVEHVLSCLQKTRKDSHAFSLWIEDAWLSALAVAKIG